MDLLYEVLTDSSPIYAYIGIIVSVYCAYHLIHFHMGSLQHSNNDYLQACHASEAQLRMHHAVPTMRLSIQNWLTWNNQRIETLDDDGELPASLLYATDYCTQQGGKKWTLHSLSLKNINI